MISPTKMVNRRTIVLKARLDPIMVKLLGKKLKGRLFAKIGFLKPKPEEVRLVSVDKYYEPYIAIGGRYAIDYCKKRIYSIKVDENTREVTFLNKKFKPEPLNKTSPSPHKAIKLDGVAYFHYEDNAYCILDMMGREVDPEQLPYAPSKKHTMEESSKARMKLLEVRISSEEEIEFLRSKIVNRPSDVEEVIKEVFEVNERALIYCPMYQLTFKNLKTGKEAIAKIDAITGKVILGELGKIIPSKVIRDLSEAHSEDLLNIEEDLVEVRTREGDLPESQPITDTVNGMRKTGTDLSKVEGKLEFPAKVGGEVFHVGDNVTAIVGDLEIPSDTTVFETLVVKGHLKIGTGCRILEKVKALKDIIIGANTIIDGNVVSGRNVVVGPNSVIHGSVESAGDVEINERTVIEGSLYSKSSVALTRFARVLGTVNAAKGISVVKDGKDD
jgi:predicted acyltransferase (DUF342 family)